MFGSSQPQQRLDTSVISASDWAEDLYLITHWINYTSLTLTNRPGAPYVLKELGPEMGVKFPHVLHTMLALSAAHLAAKMPDKHEHYSTLAARHQQNASQQFQATIQDIRKDNVVAIFVTAALLSVNCLANLSHARNASGVHEPSLDDIVAVFSMTGGLTGLEVGIAGGSGVVGTKLLEAVFGEDAVRRMALGARTNLETRIKEMLEDHSALFYERLDAIDKGPAPELIARTAQEVSAIATALKGGHQ